MPKDWRRRNARGYFVSSSPRYMAMLKYESVKKWISDLRRKTGWRTTVPIFLRTLCRFTAYADKDPDEIIAIAADAGAAISQEKKLRVAAPEISELAQDFISRLVNSGKRESARQVRTCLKSFFKANGIALKLRSVSRAPKDEFVIPSRGQIYAMADYTSSLRDRAIILCMYQSGLGVTPIRNLNFRHVKAQLERNSVPIRIHITPQISERGSQMSYFTFFGAEACEALKVYIDNRRRKIEEMMKQDDTGEFNELDESSVLFASEGRNAPIGGRMAVSSIWRVIKDAAERVGLQREKFKPKCLRKAFEAELNRSLMDIEVVKYLMGKPTPSGKCEVEVVQREYLACNFSRTEISKLSIVKEFVRSIGLAEINEEVFAVMEKNPNMTEMDAIIYLTCKKCAIRRESSE